MLSFYIFVYANPVIFLLFSLNISTVLRDWQIDFNSTTISLCLFYPEGLGNRDDCTFISISLWNLPSFCMQLNDSKFSHLIPTIYKHHYLTHQWDPNTNNHQGQSVYSPNSSAMCRMWQSQFLRII